MARSSRKKKGGRKLEFAIYIACVLLVALLILGIIKGVQAIVGSDDQPESGVSASQNESGASVTTESSASSPVSSQNTTPSSQVSSLSTTSSAVSSATASSANSNSTTGPKASYLATTSKSGVDELSEWYLLLVNGSNTIDSSFTPTLTSVDSGGRLDSRIVEPYRDMVNAAAADGVTLWCLSGYRPYSTQQQLYSNRVDRAKRENPSFTQKQAEDYAATHVARPGTSEHQTGLAVDFNSVETSFGSTSAGKWLKENAHKYGFILRYESNKQSLTGVTWEPWHYRFVGVKHATRMKELEYCLEEYVAYIQKGGQ